MATPPKVKQKEEQEVITSPAPKTLAAFDFAAFKKNYVQKPITPKPLFMVVVGARASGKSFLLGTCPGDALLLCSRQEHHSHQAAIAGALKSGNKHSITPMWIDFTDDGEILDSPEKVWNRVNDRLEALINTPDVEKLFPYIFLDSLNAFERYTSRKDNVLIASQFQKTVEATANLVKVIIDKLLRLRAKGINIIVTMAAEVKDKPEGGLTIVPMLTGYRTADEVIGSFPDIAVAVRIQVENEDGSLEDQHVLQFKNAEGAKSGKRFSGEAVTTTFSPRLQSIPRDMLPVYTPANITELQQLIKETFDSMSS